MYCGDETGAFIGDVGSKTSRFGYGGEDCPKVVIPSAAYKSINTNGDNSPKGRKYKYSAPVSLMRIPPDNCFSTNDTDGDVGFVPIYSSMNSNQSNNTNNSNVGMVQDIDAWGSLWEYSYSALCVRGKGKHTKGYQFNNEQDLQPQGASKLSSQTISTQSNNNIDVPIDHPLLAVDSTSRTIPTREQDKQRSQMLEVLFETLSAPASYIAPTSMLSSFAYGRQTALVVDIGHSGSSVTPVVDGYCLSNGSVRSGRGGKWLGDVQQSVLEGGWDVNGSVVNKWNGWGDSSDEGNKAGVPPCLNAGVVPRYLLRSATPQNKLQLLKQSSFYSMATQEVMYEMMTSSHILPLDTNNKKESVIPFCGYGKGGDSMAVDIDVDMAEEKKDEDEYESTGCYVLPDGTKVDLTKSKAGQDLCRLPELLFSETLPYFIQPPATDDTNNYSSNMLPLQKLIHKSLTEILDIDLRKELSSNIILTGGVSLFPNLDKRLSLELGKVLPSSNKYKVVASKSTVENRYSAWIGGSILSSLGSFQQLWLSKKEYEECGAVLGLQRFGS